ncbi:MAG: CopG family transcriptional regulator [Egibacteraceae bacterium]
MRRPARTVSGDDDIVHAVEHALAVFDMGEDEGPIRSLHLGPDRGRPAARDCRAGALRRTLAGDPREQWTEHFGWIVITEKEIERLTAEAEAGYEPTCLRRRGGRTPMGSGPAEAVPVRLDPELRQALEARAQREATTVSEVIRCALRDYLDVA